MASIRSNPLVCKIERYWSKRTSKFWGRSVYLNHMLYICATIEQEICASQNLVYSFFVDCKKVFKVLCDKLLGTPPMLRCNNSYTTSCESHVYRTLCKVRTHVDPYGKVMSDIGVNPRMPPFFQTIRDVY